MHIRAGFMQLEVRTRLPELAFVNYSHEWPQTSGKQTKSSKYIVFERISTENHCVIFLDKLKCEFANSFLNMGSLHSLLCI